MLFYIGHVNAYYYKFIAENPVTGFARYVFFGQDNQESLLKGNNTNTRNFSHIFLLGTPQSKSIIKSINEKRLKRKTKMMRKKKTQEKINKELGKYPNVYTALEIPEWDDYPGVTVFVTSLDQNNLFKKNNSSKVPVDINLLDSAGNMVCSSTGQLKTIKLTEQDKWYIAEVYELNDIWNNFITRLASDTIHIKYYEDPSCFAKKTADVIDVQ